MTGGLMRELPAENPVADEGPALNCSGGLAMDRPSVFLPVQRLELGGLAVGCGRQPGQQVLATGVGFGPVPATVFRVGVDHRPALPGLRRRAAVPFAGLGLFAGLASLLLGTGGWAG